MKLSCQPDPLAFLKDNPLQVSLFFTKNGLLVKTHPSVPFLPVEQTIAQLELMVLSSHKDQQTISIYCQVNLSEDELKVLGFEECNLRKCLAQVDPTTQSQILKSYQWINWDKASQFCGKCGAKVATSFETTQKQCSQCQLITFPKMSPAVMVLIYREKEILLARSPHFKKGIYSAIAGFIDIGESAELAAHREVKEELNIEITQLSYFATQAWPFPDSFMIAYTAKHLKGDIDLDGNELEDAKWFNKHNLPELPQKASISRKLIDSVLLTL